ncbi:MAG: hypothetical protein ACYTAN_11675 [Planctomycetota bacterium]|jgi:hypothetical protein
MRYAIAGLLFCLFCGWAAAAPPDISDLPDHPRLYIGGVKDNPAYIDADALVERMKGRPEQFGQLADSSDLAARALAAMVASDKDKLAGVVADLKEFQARRGEAIARAALAFDWVATALSDEDRKAIAKQLGDVAQEHAKFLGRINPWDNNPLRRDMGVGLVALAIAGDDERAEALFTKSWESWRRFIEIVGDGVPPEDWAGRGLPGGGWPEGHDYDRHGTRYAMIYFLGLRSATGFDVFTGSDYWSKKILFHIYTLLPDMYHTIPWQDDDHPYAIRHDRDVMLFLANEYKDPHARWYLNHVNKDTDSQAAIFEFLFNEPDWEKRDFTDLPKAHYIPGIGAVYARSGWGPNDTYLAFLASDWYVYHQNNAQNVFAIYRNAPLAVKDGVYDGSVHEHYVNYSIRTVAYNGITVKDPDEVYGGPDGISIAANDGGQMINQWKRNPQSMAMWREQAHRTDRPRRDIVDFLAFDQTDDYCYMAAEAGRAYRPGKVPFFSRQMLFVYPNWIICFDRVEKGNPAFETKFRVHAPEEMEVSGSGAVITTRKTNDAKIPGRLFVESLLPKGAKVDRVDGIATYDGMSFPGGDAYHAQLYCPHHLVVTAPEEKISYFLTAMYACDADVEKAPKATIVEETDASVTLELEGVQGKVKFAKTGEVAWEMTE